MDGWYMKVGEYWSCLWECNVSSMDITVDAAWNADIRLLSDE